MLENEYFVFTGTLTTMAASTGEMSQFASWASAIIVGGGTATAVQMSTVAVRGISTATTGGIANPLVSTGEWISALIVSVMAFVVPVLVVIVGFILMIIVIRWVMKKKRDQIIQPLS